jgi:hypothetical protein
VPASNWGCIGDHIGSAHACPKSFKIWPTSLVGGERPVVGKGKNASEVGAEKRDLVYNIPSKYITCFLSSPGASVGMRE